MDIKTVTTKLRSFFCLKTIFVIAVLTSLVIWNLHIMKERDKKEIDFKKQIEQVYSDSMKKEMNEKLLMKLEIEYIEKVKPDISIKDALEIYTSIKENQEKAGLSEVSFLSICSHESKLVKTAKSKSDDHGICQINKKSYQYLVDKNIIKDEWNRIYEISYNIYVASIILKLNKIELKNALPNANDGLINDILILSYNRGPSGSLIHSNEVDGMAYFKAVSKIEKRMVKDRIDANI